MSIMFLKESLYITIQDKYERLPATQFNSFIKPPFIHGFLHQLGLQKIVHFLVNLQPATATSHVCHPLNQFPQSGARLTMSTHSMRGRRTEWLPERPMTQAGVSGEASIRAITASTPSLVLCKHTFILRWKKWMWVWRNHAGWSRKSSTREANQ